jgi:uncharacterized protein YgiM (DUF1202 family)
MLGAVVCLAGLLGGCSNEPPKAPAIGSAFAGPIKLELHEEISPASKVIATAKHGEKLDVLQVRRRFVRVRTPNGRQGWTTSRNLLSQTQMQDLQSLSDRTAKLPAQGEATVYDILNMHPQPSRVSPTFYQIAEGMRVDVLAHKLSPRNAAAPPGNTFDLKKPPPSRAKRKKKEPEVEPPPRPAAPKLPPNWIELSKTIEPEPPPPPPEEAASKKKKRRVRPKPSGPPMEDWTLVRTKDGKAGWVLSRMLVMAIPDEVAQYSEGARITSYFPLAEVNDDGQIKHHWLWTTIRDNSAPYEYDSFRVFTYVVRRHRYETAYIERGIEGYYPTDVTPGSTPKFSLILREADGKLYKKTWIMEGYMVRKIGEEPYVPKSSDAPEQKNDPSISDKIRSLLDDTD